MKEILAVKIVRNGDKFDKQIQTPDGEWYLMDSFPRPRFSALVLGFVLGIAPTITFLLPEIILRTIRLYYGL